MNFKFLDIPVTISPAFWLFVLFFTDILRDPRIENFIIGIVLAISLLVHEYGHAITARYFGFRSSITLEAFGGYAEYNSRGVTFRQQFLITLMGPLFESVLILQSYILLQCGIFENYYVQYFLYATMRLNILWCLLNLIPVSPLDGGQLVRAFLEKYFRYSGYKASILISMISTIILAPYLYFQGYTFFSILLLIYGFQNFQLWQESKI